MPARPSRTFVFAVGALALTAGVSAGPSIATPRPFAVPATKPLTRITFVATPGSSILLHGTYPSVPSPCRDPVERLLHARFEGTIEVGKDTDGTLFVVGELPFEDYLKGIAEVPMTWPMQALEAQVVAARTYALSHFSPDETGQRLGYQLCATDQCQVYRGLGVSDGPYGDRWRKAVARTAGQALLYQGKPANTMFFSTSNGQTHGNDEIFGGAPLPYLRPVTEHDDGASPLSHWRTSLPFGDVARFMAEAGDWPSGTAITGIRRTGDSIVVTGTGTSKTLDVVEFRIDLNSLAHCLDPDTYPTVDGGARLPQTVPSRWFDLTSNGGTMTLTGRGWGHGVGMVQWGAEGKAARGLSYRDILADYYGGLKPVAYREPATIRVGVALGLRSVVVAPTGSVDVEGRSLGPGPWLLTGGTRLLVRHAEAPPSYIDAGRLRAGHSASSGQTRHATISIPEASVVRLVLHSGSGDVQATRPRTYRTGSTRIAWTVPDVFTGTYRLQAEVTDGIDIVRTKGVRVRVAGVAPSPTPPPSPTVSPLPTAVGPAVPSPSPAAAGGDSGLIWL
ncbi:MAG TPA: SpoIID/LytB domain-containing protein, partial [Actinomycetota bacterium]